MAKQAYVVWSGREPGIYRTWAECKRQVDGYRGARFKGYSSLQAAEQAYASELPPSKVEQPEVKPSVQPSRSREEVVDMAMREDWWNAGDRASFFYADEQIVREYIVCQACGRKYTSEKPPLRKYPGSSRMVCHCGGRVILENQMDIFLGNESSLSLGDDN